MFNISLLGFWPTQRRRKGSMAPMVRAMVEVVEGLLAVQMGEWESQCRSCNSLTTRVDETANLTLGKCSVERSDVAGNRSRSPSQMLQ